MYRQLRLTEKGRIYENENHVGAGECDHDFGTRVRRWAEVERWKFAQRHIVAVSQVPGTRRADVHARRQIKVHHQVWQQRPRHGTGRLQSCELELESNCKRSTGVWLMVADECEVWCGIASRPDRERRCERTKLCDQRWASLFVGDGRWWLLRTGAARWRSAIKLKPSRHSTERGSAGSTFPYWRVCCS